MCIHRVCKISVIQLPGRYLCSSGPQILQLAPRKTTNLLDIIYFNLIVQGRMFRWVLFLSILDQFKHKMPNQGTWSEQNKLFTVERCQPVKGGGKLSLHSVKSCCVGKPSVSPLHLTLKRDSCSLHITDPVHTPEGASRGSFSEESCRLRQTQQLMLITNR